MQTHLERMKLEIKILSFFSAINFFIAFIYLLKEYTIFRACEFLAGAIFLL